MKNTFKVVCIAVAAVLALSTAACAGGGNKSFNNAKALKKYLDSQPANGLDKPIKITVNADDKTIEDIAATISSARSAGKCVSLTLSGNALTTIPKDVFTGGYLTSVTIPDSVTSVHTPLLSIAL